MVGVAGFEPALILVRSERDYPVADTPINWCNQQESNLHVIQLAFSRVEAERHMIAESICPPQVRDASRHKAELSGGYCGSLNRNGPIGWNRTTIAAFAGLCLIC